MRVRVPVHATFNPDTTILSAHCVGDNGVANAWNRQPRGHDRESDRASHRRHNPGAVPANAGIVFEAILIVQIRRAPSLAGALANLWRAEDHPLQHDH